MHRPRHLRPDVWFGLALILASLAAAVLTTTASAEPSDPAATAAIIDRFVAKQSRASGPGVAVAVLRHGDVVRTAAAGGASRGRPLTTNTPMRIESLSKSFTATAVMQLVEKDQIDLDQPVRRYLPEFVLDDPRAAEITVRQLLTQTSGMTDATAPDLYVDDVRTLKEAVKRLAPAHLASDPGLEFAYHNPNYHVLARMVEVVSGEQFAAYLHQHIFTPAGMTRTIDVSTAAEKVPGMATGHLTAFGRPVVNNEADYFVDGAGGVLTTADDLAKWLRLQSNGGRTATGARIVSAASIDLMHTPQSPGNSHYGFGWYTAESAEGPPLRTSHSGAGAGFGAYAGLFTESGWAVAVIVNHGAGLTASDPSVVGQNLLSRLDPTIPALEERGSGLLSDTILGVLTLATIAWALISIRRAHGWATRRLARRRWLLPVLILPQLLGIGFVLAVPTLQLLATQRTAPWALLFSVEPVAVVFVATVGAACAAVIVARTVHTLAVLRN